MSLHVSNFGGGTVIAGAPDTRNVNEVLAAESFDIGPRGALIAAAGLTNYLKINDTDGSPWTRLYALLSVAMYNYANVVAVGEGLDTGDLTYLWAFFNREGQSSPLANGGIFGGTVSVPVPTAQGVITMGASFPGVFKVKFGADPVQSVNVYLINIGAREGFGANTAPGLYVFATVPPDVLADVNQIMRWDALGTGDSGSLNVEGHGVGTKGKQLCFRGIIAYNNHVFGWGFDNSDATNGDGPNRVMFCNLGNPLKWGNDNLAAGTVDRDFSDSDAIVLGDAGERIRGAIKWRDKLWFGTNQQLHYIAGYGRDSFLTDGAHPVAKSHNIIGPTALIEGPDTQLYGVSDQGLWSTADGNVFAPLFQKLRDFAGHSAGWFDCIWTDPARTLASYPGRTNADLVWMANAWDLQSVLIGIPFCNATSGTGFGNDTMVIKYNVQTRGFTRQTFLGQRLTAIGYFRAEGQQQAAQLVGTATAGKYHVQRLGYKANNASSPVLAESLPHVTIGQYVPFSPDGGGVVPYVYLTVAWEKVSASLPLRFHITLAADQSVTDAFDVFIQSTRPLNALSHVGDFWLDTSQTNTSLGNASAGVGIPARGGYLLNSKIATNTWRFVPGQGESGNRVTLRFPLTRFMAARYVADLQTIAANGRFQLEGFGIAAGDGDASAGAE